ncbi:MarR family transcriptional regulator [Streptomyces sp. SID3343]|uniref:MarR family transcriptional regulator n=1 Tax=Streptomyces sp. SID3343 TaxID=2690260 RepID=UPI001EFFD3A1|nr:MarR family transcriptional regulator [Streptomyces sp. SID3343]
MDGGDFAETAAPVPGHVTPEPLLIELVTLAQRRLTRTLTVALSEEDCTFDQWLVMRTLADGGSSGKLMGELAHELLIPHASLTRIVDALADAGRLYRRQSSEDRRRIAVHLSRRGHERLERLNALAAAHEAAVRASCASDDPGRIIEHLAGRVPTGA